MHPPSSRIFLRDLQYKLPRTKTSSSICSHKVNFSYEWEISNLIRKPKSHKGILFSGMWNRLNTWSPKKWNLCLYLLRPTCLESTQWEEHPSGACYFWVKAGGWRYRGSLNGSQWDSSKFPELGELPKVITC